jgi:erythromycin esterase-like protein
MVGPLGARYAKIGHGLLGAVARSHQDVLTSATRDRHMAENAEWISKTYLPGQRVMLWAHNAHIGNTGAGTLEASMGSFLTADLGAKYFPVGSAFGGGSFQASGPQLSDDLRRWDVPAAKPGSVESELGKLGKPLFFLDFGALDDAARHWLDAVRPMREIGAVYDPAMADQFYVPISVGQAFRGLIYFAKTTRARPLPSVMRDYDLRKDWQ